MNRFDDADDPRRRWLIQALSAGFFGAGVADKALAQQIFGSAPGKLENGRSIYRFSGVVTVDGKPVNPATQILPGSVVETGKDSEIIFAVGDNAFIMRANSRMVIERPRQESSFIGGLNLLAGRLLSVFGKKKETVSVRTKIASIGIRGTGVYLEAEPDQTYFCTCYGVADVVSNDDPKSRDTVVAKHHDRPVYIMANAPAGKGIRPGPFINHTDQELMLVETLVGRTPPFVFPKDDYQGPRRNY